MVDLVVAPNRVVHIFGSITNRFLGFQEKGLANASYLDPFYFDCELIFSMPDSSRLECGLPFFF